MTGEEIRAIRHQVGLSEWEWYRFLYGEDANRANAKLKIRQFERGVRDIPPIVARLATMACWHYEANMALPAWKD